VEAEFVEVKRKELKEKKTVIEVEDGEEQQ